MSVRRELGGPTPAWPAFHQRLRDSQTPLHRTPVATLQVNLGKLCNQACRHCHVDAGPRRTEIMDGPTVDRIIALLQHCDSLTTVDLTGGAPELNPHFRRLVTAARARGLRVIDRCNLSVLFEPGQQDTAEFLADSGVDVVASMPCYSRENVDRQRGQGVFGKSIDGLLWLNRLGYAAPDSDLCLDLVYNPGGAFLPPGQLALEADYKRILDADFGIRFSRLLTITNMPIARWADWLRREDRLADYMALLVDRYNPAAAAGVMCRDTLSVGHDGQLYDCDFNQMLAIPLARRAKTIWDLGSLSAIDQGAIALDDHCYGCTAGAGSSCGGATA